MSFSKINKSVSIETKISCKNKSDFILSAGFIKFNQVFSIIIVKDNDTFKIFRAEIKNKLHKFDAIVCCGVDCAAWVEFFQLSQTCFSSGGISNLIGAAVEISSYVFDRDNGLIKECDLFGACENEIFGDFDRKLSFKYIYTPVSP